MTTYDDASAAEWQRRLASPMVVCREAVGSALDLLHDLAAAGAPGGTVVLADEQLRGRGRRGRAWYSPPGKGIWMAYLHRSPGPPPSGVLALRVGLTLAEALASLGVTIQLKWPNDVLIRGRKLAGILCEMRAEQEATWVAIGIGMNVHGPLPDELKPLATTLDAHAPGVTRAAVLEGVVPRLHRLDVAPRLAPAEHEAFARVDWLAGRDVEEPVRGTACGIDADGALLVDGSGGIERVLSGTVRVA